MPKYSPPNLHNTSFYKENTGHQRVSATAGDWQPHTTAVKMALNTNAQINCNNCLLETSHNSLCIYWTKRNYNRRITLFLVNFLMDLTHCNIGPPMGKFWMSPIITSLISITNYYYYKWSDIVCTQGTRVILNLHSLSRCDAVCRCGTGMVHAS